MIRRIGVCVAGLLLSCSWGLGGADPAPAPAVKPAVKPRTTPKPEEIKKAVDRLVREGEGALAAGDFRAARDSFMDALQLDKKNMQAGHGLGLAYIGLNEPLKASDALEAAVAMGNPDRALLINLAVAQSSCGRAMRGAKFILKYLDSLPPTQAPDEPLLNTMKIMLEIVPPNMRTTEYARMQSTYDKLNKRLEEKVGNGQKRWGLKWVPAEEVADYEKQRKAAEQEMQTKQRELATLERDAQAAYDNLELEKGRRLEGSTVLLRAQARFDQAKKKYDDALEEYEKLAQGVPQPEYPKLLSTVPMGDVAGSTNDPTKVAAAATTDPAAIFPDVPTPPEKGTSAAARGSSGIKPMVASPKVQFGGARQDVARQVTKHSAGFLVAPELIVTSAASVKDASSIEVLGRDGSSARAEVVRSEGPLALLKVDFKGTPRPSLALAAAPATGTMQCLAFASPTSIFEDEGAEVIDGVTLTPAGEARMRKHPRLPGSPLMAGGKVVGVELADRDSPLTAIPVANLEKLKALVGGDGGTAPPARDPLDALYQIKSEIK